MADTPQANPTDIRDSRSTHRSRLPEAIGVASIFALAAWLRLGWPGVNSFSFDEARLSHMALMMARGGQFAALGMQSSAGFPNFPAAVWIFALPYRVSTDPLAATMFTGLLGTLAVAGAWWLARRAWGPWAAFSAALLFAASPFAVLYSRSIWSQNLLPFLAVVWAMAGAIGVSQRRGRAIALHIFLAGFIFQVHYAGLALIPVTLWLCLRFALWRHWQPILAGSLIAAAAALPFVYTIWCCGEGAQADLQAALDRPTQIDLSALKQTSQMGIGAQWEPLWLGGEWTWEEPLASAVVAARWAAGGLIAIGAAAASVQAWRDRRDRRGHWRSALAALVPAWALSTTLVFLIHRTPVNLHYQLVALPAVFLAAGLAASVRRSLPWQIGLTGLALAVALSQVVSVAYALDVAGSQATPGGISTPLQWHRAAAAALKDGRPSVVHARGDAPEFFGNAAVFTVLLWDYPHRIVDGQSVLLIPDTAASPAHVFATSTNLPAWEEAQASGIEGTVRLFPRRAGESLYADLVVSGGKPRHFQLIEPVTLANGVQLLGWRMRPTNRQLRLTTWWKVAGPPQPGRYHQFNHLRVDSDSEPLAIRDIPLSSQAWQEGDTLITWSDFDLPQVAGPYFVDVGMYIYPGVERVPVLGRPGDPLAPIRLGPAAQP